MNTRNTKPHSVTLNDLAAGLRVAQKLNCRPVTIRALTDDSRQVEPGTLFVAVPGEKTDGHDYIADALSRGAAAVVCERLPAELPRRPFLQVADARAALSELAAAFHGGRTRFAWSA